MLGTGLMGQNESPFRQDPGPDGIVCVEAENYHANVEVGGHSWEEIGPTGGFTGELGMHSPNGNGNHGNSGYSTTSEHLDYEIEFVKTGTHYVWVKAWGANGSDDSCNLGLNGVETPNTDRMTGYSNNYRWWNDLMDQPEIPQIEITEAGVHTLNLWVREDGLIVDKILLTTNPDYVPPVDGPPESPRGAQAKAAGPNPGADAMDVIPDVVLTWTPGEFAVAHNVYFGTSFDDVNTASASVLVSEGQTEAAYDPEGVLDFGQTYYWRVDEVNGAPDRTVHAGDVWSFTAEPVAYPVTSVAATASSSNGTEMGPEKTVDGSGLTDGLHGIGESDMWLSGPGDPTPFIQYEFDKVYKLHEMLVWNSNQIVESFLGLGVKDVTLEVSTDGTTWTTIEDVPPFAKAPGTTGYAANTVVALGVMAKFVKINVLSGHGMVPQNGLSEVQFSYIPVQAREPQPGIGAQTEDLDVVLQWRPGREAVTHEVLFSADSAAVLDGSALLDTVTGKTLDVSHVGLEYGSIYFWQVNEINEAETPAVHAGELWSFSTPVYVSLDDFEAYDDDCQRIFFGWLDGFGHNGNEDCGVAPYNGNGSNAIVGHDESPFAERGTVQAGSQAMPYRYDNTVAPYISEASTQAFALPGDWTQGGLNTLSLFFQGNPPAFQEDADGNITMGAAGYDIWNDRDEFRYAYKTLNGDGSITARINSAEEADVWTKAGVMIRDGLTDSAMNCYAFVTPNGRVGVQFRTATAANTTSTRSESPGDITLPFWVRLTRQGNTITGERSSDGVTWGPMTRSTQPDAPTSEEFFMSTDIKIGLAVTSHNSGTNTVAEFSDVTTTGNVTGSWTVEAVGVDMSSNDGEPIYLTVEDSAGRTHTQTHPDAQATLITDWEEWAIPLSDLSSLNLANIKSVTIGVGNADNPQAGGQGAIVIDSLRVGRPVSLDETSLEAEAADTLGSSWRVVDDGAASGGQYIGSEDGDGNDNDTAPGPEWTASYNFDATGGEYKILFLGQEAGSDSFWVRITTAASQTLEDPDQPGTGWVRFNGLDAPSGWAWDEVHSNDHSNEVVTWILAPGAHVLEIAKREDGTYLDAIQITNDLD